MGTRDREHHRLLRLSRCPHLKLKPARPALYEAFERRGEDVSKQSHQHMRSLVCAQCHTEYYFKGDGEYLTFPHDKGFTVEDIEAYYDEMNYSDYTHKISRAPILKAQHPRLRAVAYGYPRPARRIVRRLPHALRERRRSEVL